MVQVRYRWLPKASGCLPRGLSRKDSLTLFTEVTVP
jgi:hypothetical protein